MSQSKNEFEANLILNNMDELRLVTEAVIKYVKDVKETTGNNIDKYYPKANIVDIYAQLGTLHQIFKRREDNENCK